MNEYEKQGNNFLLKTNTILDVVYSGNYDRLMGFKTDVYDCTLTNKRHTYAFKFSQSLKHSEGYEVNVKKCKEYPNVSIIHEGQALLLRDRILNARIQNKEHRFNIIPKNVGDEILKDAKKTGSKKVVSWIKELITEKPRVKPTAYDILAGMFVDDSQDFQDFCETYGYEMSNLRDAQKAYAAVRQEAQAIQTLWTEEEIEMLHEIA